MLKVTSNRLTECLCLTVVSHFSVIVSSSTRLLHLAGPGLAGLNLLWIYPPPGRSPPWLAVAGSQGLTTRLTLVLSCHCPRAVLELPGHKTENLISNDCTASPSSSQLGIAVRKQGQIWAPVVVP